MGKAFLAMIVTLVAWYVGLIVGIPMNMDGDLGILFAIVVMGGFIIYFNDKKN